MDWTLSQFGFQTFLELQSFDKSKTIQLYLLLHKSYKHMIKVPQIKFTPPVISIFLSPPQW